MRVKVLSGFCVSPSVNVRPGEILEMNDVDARRRINIGYVIEVPAGEIEPAVPKAAAKPAEPKVEPKVEPKTLADHPEVRTGAVTTRQPDVKNREPRV